MGDSTRRPAAGGSSLSERLRRLGGHLATLESPAFSFGDWEVSGPDASGVTQMPWYRFSPGAEAVLRDARALMVPFDWSTWLGSPEGRRFHEPDRVATASAEDLPRLVTAIVRSERFGEGSIAGAYESGLLTAIARRAAELARDISPG